MNFNWSDAKANLKDFGGEDIILHIPKTGLPFFDALRLYGAIDLYVGLKEDVYIHDEGNSWKVKSRVRETRIKDRRKKVLEIVMKDKKKPDIETYSQKVKESLISGYFPKDDKYVQAKGSFVGLDAILQAGIRGIAAHSYETLQTSQTSKKECIALIPMSQGILAYAGKRRIETLGNIMFLPIFEGKVDLSKVVSPLRAWLGLPNILCSQVLALLALKSSLFTEGYQERLTAVTFNTNLGNRRSDNYSGLIAISSTTLGKMKNPDFIIRTYHTFRTLVSKAWTRNNSDKIDQSDALSMAYWLMQPVSKHLSTMITSQERLWRERYPHIFTKSEYVKEVFSMTYSNWHGNYEAVHKLAKAVASGIFHARMKDKEDPDKEWYDEVTMLRSAPSARAFIERAMILVEQGHRKHSLVGTAHREEAFDPPALLASIGEKRSDFETFRDLFRMYLVQESTHSQDKQKNIAEKDSGENTEFLAVKPEEEDAE